MALKGFQTVGDKAADRKDHVWAKAGEIWKCCLCGAITAEPAAYPTPREWIPLRYDRLSDLERAFCKNTKK